MHHKIGGIWPQAEMLQHQMHTDKVRKHHSGDFHSSKLLATLIIITVLLMVVFTLVVAITTAIDSSNQIVSDND